MDYSLQIGKQQWDGVSDTFKTVYYYEGANVTRTIDLEKIAFKRLGGCIWYDNRHSSVWFQVSTAVYEYDQQGNCIKQTNYFDNTRTRDTAIFRMQYDYNNQGNVVLRKEYRNDSLYQSTTYQYAPGYRKIETLYANRRIIDSREEYSDGDRLLREITYNSFLKYTEENRYSYDSLLRKKSMQTFLIRDTVPEECITTRNYYYR